MNDLNNNNGGGRRQNWERGVQNSRGDYDKSGHRPSKKRRKHTPVWLLVFADTIAIGLFLCVFSYFHHVNPIYRHEDPIKLPQSTTAPPSVNAASPTPDGTTPPASPTPTDEAAGNFAGKFLNAGEAPIKTATTYKSENVNVTVETRNAGGAVYHIADIYVTDVKFIKAAMAGGDYGSSWKNKAPVNEIGASVNAFVAINGDQCTAHREGVVVRNGTLYRDTVYRDVCVLNYDGTLETIPQAQFDISSIKEKGAWQVWSFGPMLLDNGKPMTEFNSDVKRANPRSAIGMIEPGHYVFIAVDGRGSSPGLSLEELSRLFYDLGCVTAYNLDGGDTSAMAVDGKIYSTPSGERDATDIIYVAMD